MIQWQANKRNLKKGIIFRVKNTLTRAGVRSILDVGQPDLSKEVNFTNSYEICNL